MKILVTNNTLSDLGGSETYAYSLMLELQKRKDITVHGFSTKLGLISDRLEKNGVKIITNVAENYDLILASHNSTIPFINHVSGVKIMTCHGIFPKEEQPVPKMDKYVSITKEVEIHLKDRGYQSEIIHNGIDCERFRPTTKINKELKSILSLSHCEDLNGVLRKVCNQRGIKLICLNKHANPIFDVENVINTVDLVISLGRGAYEAMACGRNVFILDKRPYINKPPLGDGIINSHNIENFLKNNCSGRFSNTVYNENLINSELDKYDYRLSEFCREFAFRELNIVNQTDKYLKLI